MAARRAASPRAKMRITIMGAGGVGGYFGAKLAKSGCEVGFVARGAHLAAMRQNGLRVESQLGEIHLPEVRASDDPAVLGSPDYVFLCVKLWDTEAAVRVMAKIVAPHTAVLSFQNGVQKDDVLRKSLGEKAVMGGVAYIGAGIARPGVIRHTGTIQRLVFGEFDGSRSERAAALLRSEEHTSELQSRQYLVCRLLLEKKKHTVRELAQTRQQTEHRP